jgi:hypothetical protein
VSSISRYQGYQRPPRACGGECRRACERTSLRVHRRCAAGGRLHLRTINCRYSPRYAACSRRCEGDDQPSWSSCACRDGPTLPLLLHDSRRAGDRGEREAKKKPRLGRRRSLLDPRIPSSEIIAAPPVVSRHVAQSPLLLRGLQKRDGQSLRRYPASALATVLEFFLMPPSRRLYSSTCLIALCLSVPPVL